jgi:transposase InsO family protein
VNLKGRNWQVETPTALKVNDWIDDYNNHRPHDALNNKTPKEVYAGIA